MTDISSISNQNKVTSSEDVTSVEQAQRKVDKDLTRDFMVGEVVGEALSLMINKSEPRSLPGAEGQVSVEIGKQGLVIINGNVAIDFEKIAEILLKLNFESEKANKDMVVDDMLNVAEQMNVSADDIMASAGLALAAGVISGAAQIGSGFISVAGGVKTFKIVNEASTVTEETVEDSTKTNTEEEASNVEEEPSSQLLGEGGLEGPEGESTAGKTEGAQQSTSESLQDITSDATESRAAQKAKTAAAQSDMQGFKGIQEQTRTFVLSQKANSISLSTQGYSQLVGGTGQIVSSAFKFGGDELQAQSKRDDAVTERRRAAMERDRQYGDTLSKSTSTIQQMFLDVEEGRHQTSSQIMRV